MADKHSAGDAEPAARPVAAGELVLEVRPLECSPHPEELIDEEFADGTRPVTLFLMFNDRRIAELTVPRGAVRKKTKFVLRIPRGVTNCYAEIDASVGDAVVREFNEPLILKMDYDHCWIPKIDRPDSTGEEDDLDSKYFGGYSVARSDDGRLVPNFPNGGSDRKGKKVVRMEINHLSGYILAQGSKPRFRAMAE